MIPHMHRYKFECDAAGNHQHRISGYTEGMVGINAFHFHYFHGISSYNNHTHYFSGITGFTIKTANGHKHRIDGILESNSDHEHTFKNHTHEDVAYHSDGTVHEAYI